VLEHPTCSETSLSW